MAQNPLVQIIQLLLKAFCGGSQGQDQQQQQQYPPQQYSQQQQGYPPQQQPGWQQQQQQQQQQFPPLQHQQQGQGQAAATWSKRDPRWRVMGPQHPAQQNHDMMNATNEKYQQLRNEARREGDDAHRCFAESQQAYQWVLLSSPLFLNPSIPPSVRLSASPRLGVPASSHNLTTRPRSGYGGRAHDLSVQGKSHQQKQDQLDDQAADWIFNENNKQSPPGTIDLHGLYVKEAIERTESAIAQAQRSGQDELRVIVGKGIHSQNHQAKIKPAVEELMAKYRLTAHLENGNSGVLVVDLQGREVGGRTRDAGGLVDELQRKQEDCVVM
ncbi:hypothetical protein EHS25_000045 [Saitozyma podzolica]|uniref:Smr domain-containing protein n=1 Tax=Saitozyma podzolica TaxID=1890683 RepID=A0A427YV03_9TREE|nr:hypothetical protein EHS25_000045 [Saitozyma podzolica]